MTEDKYYAGNAKTYYNINKILRNSNISEEDKDYIDKEFARILLSAQEMKVIIKQIASVTKDL